MSDEINVISRSQIVLVRSSSQSVSIINAGPQGPSGPGGGSDLWQVTGGGILRPITDPFAFQVSTDSTTGSGIVLEARTNVDLIANIGDITIGATVGVIAINANTAGSFISLNAGGDITLDAGSTMHFNSAENSGDDAFVFRSNGEFRFEPVTAGQGRVEFHTDGFFVLNSELVNFGSIGNEVMAFNVFSNGSSGIHIEGTKIELQSTSGTADTTITSARDLELVANNNVMIRARNFTPVDSRINTEGIVFYLDQATNKLKVRAKYSDGTLKTGEVTLA